MRLAPGLSQTTQWPIRAVFGLSLVMGITSCATDQSTTSGAESAGKPTVPMTEERVHEPVVAAPSAAPASSESAGVQLGSSPPAANASAGTTASSAQGRSPALLHDIPFRFDSDSLHMDAIAVLDVNVQRLKENKDWRLVLEGRCDEVGSSAYNLVLGERRARAVREYLADAGVPTNRIRILSYGKEQPLCVEHSETCWKQNRSVRFQVE